MREIQEQRYKRILYSKWMVILLACLIVFFARATWGVYTKEQESSANAYRATQELKRLAEREALLDSEIGRLSTPEGIEEEIRAKYGVSKPGEELLIIVDPMKEKVAPLPEDVSFWERLKNMIY